MGHLNPFPDQTLYYIYNNFYKGKITPKCYIQAKRNDNNYSSMN